MSDFVERSLLDLVEFIVDNRGRTCPTTDEGFPLIATNCLKDGQREVVFENVRFVDEATYSDWFRAHPQAGDVLFVCKGSPGRVALVPDPVPYCIAQDMVALRANRSTDPGYLYYRLRARDVRSGVENMHVGTMIPHFKKGDFGRLRFLVHRDTGEQRAIAEILGALDDKIEANERAATAALDLGDRLFDREAKLSNLSTTTIGELADRSFLSFGDGYRTKKSEYGRPGLRILRAGDVRNSYVYPSGQDFVAQSYSRQIGAKASQPGDVVLTTKGTVGRVAVVAAVVEQVVYSPQVCYFRAQDEDRLDRGYLATWFRSKQLQEQCAMVMHKSDMAPYISLRDIRSMSVSLPSIEEQRRQGEVQRDLLATFEANRAENEALARTRDELLPLLMSGKLRVKDVGLDPAEVL